MTMVQATIEALLSEKIGLDANTIGSSKITRAVETRRQVCGLPDVESYLRRLQTVPQELEDLIESVVVPETWFFRDRKPFEFLGRYALSEWLANPSNAIVRLLSLPCCTGEEPFSMAITLLEAGLKPTKFSIDAIDISHHALSKAQTAIYGKNSFRGQELCDKQHYFQQRKEGYQVSDLVRQQVNFKHGNILELFTAGDKVQYDIIFCRNLLIYFDDSARSRAISILERLLKPKGLLFVGSAETGMIPTQNFVSVRQPFTFAYQKMEAASLPESKKPLAKSLTSNVPVVSKKIQNSPLGKLSTLSSTSPTSKRSQSEQSSSTPNRTSMSKSASPATPLSSKEKSQISPSLTNLKTARDLANRGKLEEAATLCKTYLSQQSTSVEAYLLLGEIYQGLGKEEEAEQYFRKVIYLDPNHYEALMHLALIKEHRGDIGSATLIRQRIQRLQRISHP